MLASALRRKIGEPRRRITADAGDDANNDTDDRRAQNNPAVFENLAKPRDDPIDPGLDDDLFPFPDGVEYFRYSVGPDEYRDKRTLRRAGRG